MISFTVRVIELDWQVALETLIETGPVSVSAPLAFCAIGAVPRYSMDKDLPVSPPGCPRSGLGSDITLSPVVSPRWLASIWSLPPVLPSEYVMLVTVKVAPKKLKPTPVAYVATC
jgi:hypothetical protein